MWCAFGLQMKYRLFPTHYQLAGICDEVVQQICPIKDVVSVTVFL